MGIMTNVMLKGTKNCIMMVFTCMDKIMHVFTADNLTYFQACNRL